MGDRVSQRVEFYIKLFTSETSLSRKSLAPVLTKKTGKINTKKQIQTKPILQLLAPAWDELLAKTVQQNEANYPG